MHEQWTNQFSSYLDGELDAVEREAVEAHLQSCAECRQVLAELNEVAETARRLTPRTPDADLWPGIAARIRAETEVILLAPRRRFWSPQAVAAGIGLVLLGAGSAWWARGLREQPAPQAAVTPAPDSPFVRVADNRVRTTDAAISELDSILRHNIGQLDTATVRVVTQNLAIIDRAIADAERALAADPANPYVRRHLASATKRKIELLRRTAELATAQS